jgi:hypothetical protein
MHAKGETLLKSNQPAMKAIRYNVHFPVLIVAVLLFWLAKDLDFPVRILGFISFPFVLMGALHATSIIVSLRDRKAVRPIIALCFILLAAVWSAATPMLALWGTILSAPVLERVPRSDFAGIFLFLVGSAIGSSGYWLLVRLFCLKSLRIADWLRTMALCVVATLLCFIAPNVLIRSLDANTLLTVAWWFAFSLSLYWSEARGQAKNPKQAMEAAS